MKTEMGLLRIIVVLVACLPRPSLARIVLGNGTMSGPPTPAQLGAEPACTWDGAIFRCALPNGAGTANMTPGSVSLVPAAVQSLAPGALTSTTLSLSWSAPATGPAPVSYTISFRPAGAGSYTQTGPSTTNTSATIAGLTPHTAYDVQVIASNAVGKSPAATLTGVSTIGSTLTSLSLSATRFAAGQTAGTVLATIGGQSSGSTLAISASDTSGIFAVSGANLIAGPNFATAYPMLYVAMLTETLAGATNSPATTTMTTTVVGPNNVPVPIFGNGPTAAVLTFSDEFNGTGAPDPTKWTTLTSDTTGNNWTTDVFEPSANTVSGGFLRQTVSAGGTAGRAYTAALIFSGSHFSQAYGYWEARAKMPTGGRPGGFAAFWLNTPPNGLQPETDDVEWFGSEPAQAMQTDYQDASGATVGSFAAGAAGSPDLAAAFHVYGMLWTPTDISFLIDGIETRRLTDGQVVNGVTIAIASTPKQILFDNSCASSGIVCTAATVIPFSWLVDYVHVYQTEGTGTAVAAQSGYGGPGDAVGSGTGPVVSDDTGDLVIGVPQAQ